MTRTDLATRTSTGKGLTLAEAWHRLTDEARKRDAVTAVNARDA